MCNTNFLIHNKCRLITKKKKDIIESYKDLRGIAIMPAIIMIIDKIIAPTIKKLADPLLSKN